MQPGLINVDPTIPTIYQLPGTWFEKFGADTEAAWEEYQVSCLSTTALDVDSGNLRLCQQKVGVLTSFGSS